MENNKTIPNGYMTVGELAKKMNTTVRTLQYYDKEGLLTPSAESEGGRRLYNHKDMVRLHQILSMKYLGFSLDDIKNRLISLETPEEVAYVLTEQAELVREKINALSEALSAIEALKNEIVQIQTVDFEKYADIISLLQFKNECYWVVKHFDEKLMEHIRNRFDEQSGTALINTWKLLCEETALVVQKGMAPESEQGQAVAKKWWDMVTEFTGGDMSLLPQIMKFNESKESWSEEWRQKQALADGFIGKALEVYFNTLGSNPIEGVNL